MLEWSAVGATKAVIDTLRWLVGATRSRRSHLSNADVLACREKWRPVIDRRLAIAQRDGLGRDVYVRDIARMDDYPHTISEGPGDPSWFRAGLVATEERHVLLLLSWVSLDARLIESMRSSSRRSELSVGDEASALIGYVPFEQIVEISWEGDDYNGLPSIFLHFDARRRSPFSYEAYCHRNEMDGQPGQKIEWYTEICTLRDYQIAERRRNRANRWWRFQSIF